MSNEKQRPKFIRNFREMLEPVREWAPVDIQADAARFSKQLGLSRIGIRYEIIPPGHRTSLPHAHEKEEEFIFVVEGRPDVWIDGVLHSLGPGDGVAFPAGTGIAHTFINNSAEPVHLLVYGEKIDGERINYPVDAEAQSWPIFWHGAPRHELGPHDGCPNIETGAEPRKK